MSAYSLTEYNIISNHWSEWSLIQILDRTPGGHSHIKVTGTDPLNHGLSVTIFMQKKGGKSLRDRSEKFNDFAWEFCPKQQNRGSLGAGKGVF